MRREEMRRDGLYASFSLMLCVFCVRAMHFWRVALERGKAKDRDTNANDSHHSNRCATKPC